MGSEGFTTDRVASFIATLAELRSALPDWRVPLSEPVLRKGRNPFTGAPLMVTTTDPGPDRPVTVPVVLPFEHVLLPNEEDWESRYVALDLVLAGDEGAVPDFFKDSDGSYEVVKAEQPRGSSGPVYPCAAVYRAGAQHVSLARRATPSMREASPSSAWDGLT